MPENCNIETNHCNELYTTICDANFSLSNKQYQTLLQRIIVKHNRLVVLI